MITKTYQAESMIQALKMIQEELGSEAIVLSVRELQSQGPAWQRKQKAGVEVVAMTSHLPERTVPVEAAPQSQKTAPVLRANPNNGGIEFIEETPVIEWEQDDKILKQPGSKRKEDDSSAKWQPKRLTRDEVIAINRGETPAVNEPSHTPIPQPGKKAEKTETLPAAKPQIKQPAVESEAPQPSRKLSAALQNIANKLAAQGVEADYVGRLFEVACEVLPPYALEDEKQSKTYLTQAMSAELITQSNPLAEPPGRIIVLVGATGSGKTSTTAKLAYFYSTVLHKKVAWASADTVRTGAVVETRSFTDALGIPLYLLYTPQDVRELLATIADEYDLILVDTPGINPYNESQIVELGEMLTEIPNRFTCLVAPATTKDADLQQAVNALAMFSLKGLVLSKLDETFSYGSLYNLARKNRIPLTYFCTGKEANSNLQYADAVRLVSGLFGKGWMK